MGVPTYNETDPVSARWTGVGRLLSAFEVDQNFYYHEARIEVLEGAGAGVHISYITLHGDQLEFHMSDHTIQGPFTIPLAVFRNRGTWTASTPYSVYDLVTFNGAVYIVDIAHTSALTFDPNATDGLGHNLYTLLINIPGSSLPAGGATAQVLQKSTSADYAVTWGYKLPTGGSTGQVLVKNSSTNQDASWAAFPGVDAPPASPAGHAGDALATNDGTSTNMEWIQVVYAPSSNGITGQVPATTDGSKFHTHWISPIYAPPASPAGAAGDLIATVDGTFTNTEWIPQSALSIAATQLTGGPGPTFVDQTYTNLGSGGSGTVSLDPTLGVMFQITSPAGAITINAASVGVVGQEIKLIVYQFASVSQNITFGTHFKSQGTLATGTASGKIFVVTFVCDGGTWFEVSRTTAM